jgi:arylsulfatase
LYNIETDVSERFNKAPDYPEIVRDLIQTAEKHKRSMVIKPSVCDP